MMNSKQLIQLKDSILESAYKAGAGMEEIGKNTVFAQSEIVRQQREYQARFSEKMRTDLRRFADEYKTALINTRRQADKEQDALTVITQEQYAQFNLWLNMYRAQPIEKIREFYDTALLMKDSDKIYFIESVCYPSLIQSEKVIKFGGEIRKNREARLTGQTKEELEGLIRLGRFADQASEYIKDENFDKLKALFHSAHVQIPRELQIIYSV